VTLWVVSGACRGVGKTWLCTQLAAVLPGAVRAKIGHHPPAAGKPGQYFRNLRAWEAWRSTLDGVANEIVESNALALMGRGDVRIFLGPRPGAVGIREDAAILADRAHIVVTGEGIVGHLPGSLAPGVWAVLERQRDFLGAAP